tara:strand:+ start:394 stop:1266 length:873 start_codon:yes stop_codon:yes gene_type:complete
MNQIKIFIELTRLNKPIGFMLLFWPCGWGLALSYSYNQNLDKTIYYLILFFLGSILMRSAGCIINDIVDKDLDKKIKRTKYRPLASKKITITKSLMYVVILCLLAFIILIQFNKLTIILGLLSMFLAFSYPYMKRITYWPQLFLGLTFNWGIIMAWTSINNFISIEIIIFYIAAIFWTLGYDTIYGTQDIIDDEIIGVKSTSIKFKKSIKNFVSLCYLISSILISFIVFDKMKTFLPSIFMLIFFLNLAYQIKIFSIKRPQKSLIAFKNNNITGFILFCAILLTSNNLYL